ncbi:hypothetical protein DFR29_107295 [Tahibacter aquaticus]|uniref:Uncharacterized protein n=2 Tax=Tahibacter aquaticus TaxID=520092 RepID=A0A4R6YX91_9GAMM|nr:hypothetical protein DFR29_107295 [Tahibacter aquaticus]
MTCRWLATLFALCAAMPASATPAIALQNGQAATFGIPGANFSTSYYIDVPLGAAQLKLELDNQGSGNVDLLLRYGTPFAEKTSNEAASPDAQLFLDYAHYWGLSRSGDESILVQKSSRIPLRPGRWYIAVLNFAPTTQNLSLKASLNGSVPVAGINFSFPDNSGCNSAPWFDLTAAAPIDGNPGTTLGEQRRNALARAGELLAQQLQSPMPISVHACWKALGGSQSEGARIAAAGPSTFIVDTEDFVVPWLPDKYSWYAVTEAVRLSGTPQCGTFGNDCNEPDIEATFNSDLDPPVNIINVPFYYGFTGASKPARSIDFITTTMHELTHGMGFVSLINVDPDDGVVGARGSSEGGESYDDAFSRQLVAVDTQARSYQPFLGPATSDAQRASAAVSNDSVRWAGMEAVMSALNQRRDQPMPDNFPLIFAPCERAAAGDPCKTRPGSTLSHTVQAGDLMNAFDDGSSNRSLGLALPMLHALGWATTDATPPSYAIPATGNWYDRTRGGHGIDFQLYQRSATEGDLYFVIFYTFENDGLPEYYLGLGRLIDGKFIGAKQSDGIALMRLRYNATTRRTELDRSSAGNLFIDFNQAAQSPSCRSADRSGAGALALMRWSIRGENGSWCIEPAVLPAEHTTPDFSGHWYGGNASDQGWGMELLSIRGAAGQAQLVAVLYYPDQQGRSRWAVTRLADVDLANTQELTLYEVSGYCRLCQPPAAPNATRAVGTIKFRLTRPTRTEPADGANRVSIAITQPGVANFRRDDVPLTLLSAPPGD